MKLSFATSIFAWDSDVISVTDRLIFIKFDKGKIMAAWYLGLGCCVIFLQPPE